MSKITLPARLWARIDIMLDWKLGPMGLGYALSFPVIATLSRFLFGETSAVVAFLLLSLLPISLLATQHILRPKSDLASPAWLEAAIWITGKAHRAELIQCLNKELKKERPLTRSQVISLMHHVGQREEAEADEQSAAAALPERKGLAWQSSGTKLIVSSAKSPSGPMRSNALIA